MRHTAPNDTALPSFGENTLKFLIKQSFWVFFISMLKIAIYEGTKVFMISEDGYRYSVKFNRNRPSLLTLLRKQKIICPGSHAPKVWTGENRPSFPMATNKKNFEVKRVSAYSHAAHHFATLSFRVTVERSCRVVLVNLHRYLRYLP